jgi:hypothetical protein
MRTETLTQIGEQVKNGLTDKVKDLSESFTNRCRRPMMLPSKA